MHTTNLQQAGCQSRVLFCHIVARVFNQCHNVLVHLNMSLVAVVFDLLQLSDVVLREFVLSCSSEDDVHVLRAGSLVGGVVDEEAVRSTLHTLPVRCAHLHFKRLIDSS